MKARSFSKPRSSSRSASSSTSHSSRLYSKHSVFFRWSTSRPGVATTSGTPLRSRAFSAFFFSPPMSEPVTSQWKGVTTFCNPSSPCTHSSRDGRMMMARVPSARATRCSCACSFCSTGTRNASVLPLPVCDCSMASRPSSSTGIASDWMRVSVVMLSLACIVSRSRSHTGQLLSGARGIAALLWRRR